MYRNLIKISTVDMSREDWLAERKKSLGGSDVAAVIGLNDYSSPYAVYADKLGLLPEKEDTEAMRIGRDLEDYVAKRFCEKTGKKVRRENAIIRNPHMPYLHANVDRVVIGENAVLECKTVSALSLKQFKNGEYPARFYAQCCAYMLVCGFDKAYLAVLVMGKEFLIFEIERDEDELNALSLACKDFWRCVESRTPPVADGHPATANALSVLYPESNEDVVNLMAYRRDLEELQDFTRRIKELSEARDGCTARIKAFMGQAGRGETDKYKVSWLTQEKNTFDDKRFKAEHPQMDLSGYYKKSSYRTFKVSERKG